ncbi:MAG: redoxin domain-containing protein [Candidatus Riflebacteria bacterium]|nr:redoxin domain-containing protein [Candidatus Riflebacteria bacterium]
MRRNSITLTVGRSVPDFTLSSIDGREHVLSSYRGQRVLIVFLRGTW